MSDEPQVMRVKRWTIKQNHIVFGDELFQGSFEEYIEAAEELAKEKQMPVMVSPPYRGDFLVFPKVEDQD